MVFEGVVMAGCAELAFPKLGSRGMVRIGLGGKMFQRMVNTLRAGDGEWGGHGLWVMKMPSSLRASGCGPKGTQACDLVTGWLGSAELGL